MRLSSRARTALAVAALPLALAACSSNSSDSSGSSADASASAKPSESKDPNAGLLTGTQLKQALAPASYFPDGFTAVSEGAADSGDEFLHPPAKSTAKTDCTMLEATAWIGVTGLKGGVSFAQDDYMNKEQTEEVAQEIDAFQGTTATTVMQDLHTIATECATFTDSDAHAKVKVIGKDTAGLGDEAYTMTLTSGAWENGTTLIAARVGNAVVTVISTAGTDDGAASGRNVAAQAVKSLQAKQA